METVVVIGGGAAGIMAALTAAEDPGRRVILLERQQRIGRCIRIRKNNASVFLIIVLFYNLELLLYTWDYFIFKFARQKRQGI